MTMESQSAQRELADSQMLAVGVSAHGAVLDRTAHISLRTPITGDGLGGTTGE